jgi:hypothetical protein
VKDSISLMSRPRKAMSEWVVHCEVNQRHIGRSHATREAALKDACSQLLQGHAVNRIVGPQKNYYWGASEGLVRKASTLKMRLVLNTYAYADITLRTRPLVTQCPKAEDGNLRKRPATRPQGEERLVECPPDVGRRGTRLTASAARTGAFLARLHDRAGRADDA